MHKNEISTYKIKKLRTKECMKSEEGQQTLPFKLAKCRCYVHAATTICKIGLKYKTL